MQIRIPPTGPDGKTPLSRDWLLLLQALIQQSGSGGAGTTMSATTPTADILTLPTSAVTLVPAPGPGRVIQPLFATVWAKIPVAFTNINAAAVLSLNVFTGPFLSYVPNDAAITTGSSTRLTDLIGTVGNWTQNFVPYMDTEGVDFWGPIAARQPILLSVNQPLQVSIDNAGSGDLTGGSADCSLSWFISYVIVAVP